MQKIISACKSTTHSFIHSVGKAWGLEAARDFGQPFLTICNLLWSTALQSALPVRFAIHCRDDFNRFLNSTVPKLWNTVRTPGCGTCDLPCNAMFLLGDSCQQCVPPAVPSSMQLLSSEIPVSFMHATESSLSAVRHCARSAGCKRFCAETFHVSCEP